MLYLVNMADESRFVPVNLAIRDIYCAWLNLIADDLDKYIKTYEAHLFLKIDSKKPIHAFDEFSRLEFFLNRW